MASGHASFNRRQRSRSGTTDAAGPVRSVSSNRRTSTILEDRIAAASEREGRRARTRRCAAFPDFRGRASAPEMGDRHVYDLRSPEPGRCHRLSVGCGHCGIDIPWPEDQEFDDPDGRKSRSIHGASGPRDCRHDAIARRKFHILELRPEPQSRMTRNFRSDADAYRARLTKSGPHPRTPQTLIALTSVACCSNLSVIAYPAGTGFIEPCLPSLAEKPPARPDWIHERSSTTVTADGAGRFALDVTASASRTDRQCRRHSSTKPAPIHRK